ncbi:MAG: hypothetical protein JO076_05755 [Verrucomicrobia bacterium]|nr:hypothetical protein [Verrucomicrobiota bacterium]
MQRIKTAKATQAMDALHHAFRGQPPKLNQGKAHKIRFSEHDFGEGISEQNIRLILGLFSVGLGLTEVFKAYALARSLGMVGKAGLLRFFGVREIVAGIGLLFGSRLSLWLWARVAGDALDILTLVPGLSPNNPKKKTVMLALGAVFGITLIDLSCAQRLSRH